MWLTVFSLIVFITLIVFIAGLCMFAGRHKDLRLSEWFLKQRKFIFKRSGSIIISIVFLCLITFFLLFILVTNINLTQAFEWAKSSNWYTELSPIINWLGQHIIIFTGGLCCCIVASTGIYLSLRMLSDKQLQKRIGGDNNSKANENTIASLTLIATIVFILFELLLLFYQAKISDKQNQISQKQELTFNGERCYEFNKAKVELVKSFRFPENQKDSVWEYQRDLLQNLNHQFECYKNSSDFDFSFYDFTKDEQRLADLLERLKKINQDKDKSNMSNLYAYGSKFPKDTYPPMMDWFPLSLKVYFEGSYTESGNNSQEGTLPPTPKSNILNEIKSINKGISSLETMSKSNLIHTQISNPSYQNIHLDKTIFDNLKLKKADFRGAIILSNVSFKDSRLKKADFRGATIHSKVSFEKAVLNKAKFNKLKLIGVNFKEAELKDTEFDDSCFEGVDFTGAVISDETSFKNITLDSKTLATLPSKMFEKGTREKKEENLLKKYKEEISISCNL